MTVALSERGQAMLDSLPWYYQDADFALHMLDACARELDRLEGFLTTFRQKSFVHEADDTYDLLAIWEAQLGLPVEESNVLADRQTDVLALYRARGSYSGSDWVAVVNDIIGTSDWAHVENTPNAYDLRITLPFASASTTLTATQMLPTATLTVVSTTGFPTNGSLLVGGAQVVNYTGITSTTFTGCTGGIGTFAGGTIVAMASSQRLQRIEALIRTITPAHLNVIVVYAGSGFIVGESSVGEVTI